MGKTQEKSTVSEGSGGGDLAREARLTMRRAFTGSLATLDKDTGYPFASLVSVAISPIGDPILLLSGLARHTKNIAVSGKASLLLEAVTGNDDPLEAARITVQGDLAKSSSDGARARYLARHPEAASYADFADFAFYEMTVTNAHFIAGFGRIHTLKRDVLCLVDDVQLSAGAVSAYHLTDKDQETLKNAWRQQIGSEPQHADFAVVAFDRDGIDVKNGEAVQRIAYGDVMSSGSTIQDGLAKLAHPDA